MKNQEMHVYCTNCQNYRINPKTLYQSCAYAEDCWFFDTEDSAPYSKRPRYKPIKELGNVLFGNSPCSGEFPMIPREPLQEMFVDMLSKVGFDGYGVYYPETDIALTANQKTGGAYNDVFAVNPYYWGEDETIARLPNFVYKPLGLEVHWYKYPMRDAWTNYGWKEDVLLTEFKWLLNDCAESATRNIRWYTAEEKMPDENQPVIAWIDRGDGCCVHRNAVWTRHGWVTDPEELQFGIMKWRAKS